MQNNSESNLSSPTSTAAKEQEDEQWFAMRATYRSELIMKEKLQDKGFTCFVPLILVEKRIGGRKKREWKPAVSSMIFVHGAKSKLQEFKKDKPRLQYICKPNGMGGKTPIIIPEHQMAAFICLFESGKGEINDDPETINNIRPGQNVRVTEGPFQGLVGTFQRMKGGRNKRFIITLDNLLIISTTEVSPSMIEIID